MSTNLRPDSPPRIPIQGGTDRRKGSMAKSQPAQDRAEQSDSPFSDMPSHYRQLTRTPLSDIALVTSDRQVGCPGKYSCTVPHPSHTTHPRQSTPPGHTHAPSRNHTRPLAHIPFTVSASRPAAAAAQRPRPDKVWSAIPPHSHLPERPPVPGFYLRSDPSLSWPAGLRTPASPERQARPCASCTALS